MEDDDYIVIESKVINSGRLVECRVEETYSDIRRQFLPATWSSA